MGGTTTVERTRTGEADRLASAYGELAEILETVDLETDPALATELITALSATDRAYALETDTVEACPPRVPQSSAGD